MKFQLSSCLAELLIFFYLDKKLCQTQFAERFFCRATSASLPSNSSHKIAKRVFQGFRFPFLKTLTVLKIQPCQTSLVQMKPSGAKDSLAPIRLVSPASPALLRLFSGRSANPALVAGHEEPFEPASVRRYHPGDD